MNLNKTFHNSPSHFLVEMANNNNNKENQELQRVLIFLAKQKIHKIRTDDLFLIQNYVSLTRSQTWDKRS